MPDAVQIVEVPSLRLLFSNRIAETLTQETFGRPSVLDLAAVRGDVFYPDGRLYERTDWPIMRATRGEKISNEACTYVLDGKSISFLVSSAPVFDSSGSIVAAVAVGREVSVQDGGRSASLHPGL